MQFLPECAILFLGLLRQRRFPQANAERRRNRRCCGGQRDEILTLTRHEARAVEARAGEEKGTGEPAQRLSPRLTERRYVLILCASFWRDDVGSGSCFWKVVFSPPAQPCIEHQQLWKSRQDVRVMYVD